MTLIPDKPHSPLTLMEIGAIAAIVVIWGANNAAAKVATEVMPPLLVGTLRFAIAAVCLIPFVRPPFPNWKSLLLIVTLGGPLHYGLLYWGFSLAQDVSPVSVASQLWIPFTSLFAFLLLGERLSIHALIGMAVSLFGVAWMSADPHALHDWQAILLIAAATACWGMTTVIARRTTSIPPLKMQGLLAFVALPTLAFASAMFEHGQVEAVALRHAPDLGLPSVGRHRLVGVRHHDGVLAGAEARGRPGHALFPRHPRRLHRHRLGLPGRCPDAADPDRRGPDHGRRRRRGLGGAGLARRRRQGLTWHQGARAASPSARISSAASS